MAKRKKSGRSIQDRVRDPEPKTEHYGVCIYAQTGLGKTTLLGTMRGRGLVLDVRGVEEGTAVLSHLSKRIKVLDIEDWSDLNDAYHALRRKEVDVAGSPPDWVAIDTVTATDILARREALRHREGRDLRRYQIRQNDWGDMAQLQGELFLRFRKLPYHIIFVAQEVTKEPRDDDEEGITMIVPDVRPRALRDLTPSLDLIGRLVLDDEGSRLLEVSTRTGFVTKNRTIKGRRLPPVIEKPNLGKIISWMQGEEGAKKPKAAELDTLD